MDTVEHLRVIGVELKTSRGSEVDAVKHLSVRVEELKTP